MDNMKITIGDLFEVKSSNHIFNANSVVIYDKHVPGTYPYVVRKTSNNGLRGYVLAEPADTNFGNTISFAQDTFMCFYQPEPYVTGNNIKILTPKFQGFNKEIGLYIVSAINKTVADLSWGVGSDIAKIESFAFCLPTKDGFHIDFEYMEAKIKKLESARIKALQKPLHDMGLQNTKLTTGEKTSLIKNNVCKSFKISDLFLVESTKALDAGKLEFKEDGINFIGRTGTENGIQGKIDLQQFEPNKGGTITATVIGNYKYVKFQKEPYYCSQNINKLTPLFADSMTENVALYFSAHIQAFVNVYNGQQGGYKLDDLKNHTMNIPIVIKNDGTEQIDFEYIENYVAALKKQIIKRILTEQQSDVTAGYTSTISGTSVQGVGFAEAPSHNNTASGIVKCGGIRK